MDIYKQLVQACSGLEGQLLTTAEIKLHLHKAYGTNPGSVIPSDYCYNRLNKGVPLEQHKPIFEYYGRGIYRYLGPSHPFTGLIYERRRGTKHDRAIGSWIEGKLRLS